MPPAYKTPEGKVRVGNVLRVRQVCCSDCGCRMEEHAYSIGAYHSDYVFSCSWCCVYFLAKVGDYEIWGDRWGSPSLPGSVYGYEDITDTL